MFYFQSMFQQVYNGITGSAVLPAVQQIAEGILLLAALFAVYEAYAKGGDARISRWQASVTSSWGCSSASIPMSSGM